MIDRGRRQQTTPLRCSIRLRRFDFFAWWTRSQRIRTEGEVPFEAALLHPSNLPNYITIAEKALHLKELNMNPNQIAVALKVDRTTVLRALRWAKSIPVYATGPFREV